MIHISQKKNLQFKPINEFQGIFMKIFVSFDFFVTIKMKQEFLNYYNSFFFLNLN